MTGTILGVMGVTELWNSPPSWGMLTRVKIVTQSGLEVVPKQYRQVSQAGQIDIICANFVVCGEIRMLREEIDHSGCSEEESELDSGSSDSGTKLLKLPSSQIDYTFL